MIVNNKQPISFLTFVCYLLAMMGSCEPQPSIMEYCPRMMRQVFEGFAPAGNIRSGNFSEYSATEIRHCVLGCCEQGVNCNVAFVFNRKCYHVRCTTNELCLPLKRNDTINIQMVLVNPVTEDSTWMDAIKRSTLGDSFLNNLQVDQMTFDKYDPSDFYLPYIEKNPMLQEGALRDIYAGLGRFAAQDQYNDENDFQMDETKFIPETMIPCERGIERTCPLNEECIPILPKTRNGFCNCISDYTRNVQGKCVNKDLRTKAVQSLLMKPLDDGLNEPEIKTGMMRKLTVSVNSKDVRLPEKEVTLAAYTIPDEKSTNDKYKYSWSLVSQPGGDINGTMSDQTKDHIKLSNLSEGLYRFKVVVTGNNLYGEAYANVTVLPEKRINKAPVVIITPAQQRVKLPTSNAILDGSTSRDDDRIVSWHWDLVQGPLGYQPILPETSTLQLNDLTLPGNYTFRLTVTDSDNVQNSTTAYITVLKVMDYPPEANAGSDVIVYLPKNNVTLNGSLSSDDREIVAWEWTKDSNDDAKAVDMQNTRTPYLQLSNLEEGIYTFELKVTDASNQSSSAKVHVFVKQPTNLPPVVNAGTNITINLPKTWTTLNGSLTTGLVKIINYKWTQISGPTQTKICNSTESIANATGLTIGSYLFELNVLDENNNNGTDRVCITVIQEKNTPPVANAGGDQSVTLPVNTIYLNGSKSNDDFRIVNFTWNREGSSLAMGTIVGNTNHEPVLIITNIMPGRYVFKLTVSDDQGLSNSDTVSIIVRPDPMLMNLVELTLSVSATHLTQSDLDSLDQKLLLLLGDHTNLQVRELKTDHKTGEAVIVFYVEKMNPDSQMSIMSGLEVEKLLKEKFWKDSAILGTLISNVRTVVCQNTCSGHGACNAETRACMCETFWMPDIFYFWGIRDANCDWSILYVIIGVFLSFLCTTGCFWGLTCLNKKNRKPRTRAKPQKYAPLDTQEDEIPSLTRSTSLSDSDTDSDVLFESRSKPNGILRSNGNLKNGQPRMGRRIKT